MGLIVLELVLLVLTRYGDHRFVLLFCDKEELLGLQSLSESLI